MSSFVGAVQVYPSCGGEEMLTSERKISRRVFLTKAVAAAAALTLAGRRMYRNPDAEAG